MRTTPTPRLRFFLPLRNRHHQTPSSYNERQPLLDHQQKQKMTIWTAAAACISGLGGLLFGFDLGVVGGLLIAPSFQTHFGIDPNDKIREADINGNIVAILQIGCLFGSLAATLTADKAGRKWSIVFSAAVFCVGGILQVVAVNLGMLYAGRLIAGLGVGALSMLVPVYVAEIAHQSQRGLLGGLWQFFIAAGLALSYWTNYIVQRVVTDDQDNALWQVPLIVQTIPGGMLLVGMLVLFETPRQLVAHGHMDQAKQVIAKIRGWPVADPRVNTELEFIHNGMREQVVDETRSTWRTWRLVFSRDNMRRLLVGSALQAFQQLTGTNVINYYSPIIFRSIGLSSNTAELLATGVYGLVKMSVTLIAFSWMVDRYGRRKLLIGGGTALCTCMLSVAICVSTLPIQTTSTNTDVSPASYAGIVFMYLYAICFALSWGPIPWIYCSEIYPMALRAKSTSITTAINWVFNAVVGKFSPLLLAQSTIGTYIFFGLFCLVSAVFSFFYVPETKGKTLEEMQVIFETSARSSNNPPADIENEVDAQKHAR
ncbi:hypothetical protein O0I10_003596 [Lichtheimia ornata]|uniref:Major facilitator superfamily (MFS) profile domain-containing protein n=1 Tax=Lichtheimia ornata TaxID=688661 RepID=A0AAD7V7X9_9FUNG|nr:uncharacterized protein O0I10_003596 [Lichtheimia ornata]KAJ8660550.1 hypothetical protein O0I10_003596 [Lichtheimia ornata]